MNDENSTVQYSLIDHQMGNVAATVWVSCEKLCEIHSEIIETPHNAVAKLYIKILQLNSVTELTALCAVLLLKAGIAFTITISKTHKWDVWN